MTVVPRMGNLPFVEAAHKKTGEQEDDAAPDKVASAKPASGDLDVALTQPATVFAQPLKFRKKSG